jgi:hypothetical protein
MPPTAQTDVLGPFSLAMPGIVLSRNPATGVLDDKSIRGWGESRFLDKQIDELIS